MSEVKASPYSWYVVGVLTLAYLVSFLDRQILALMVEPIKADLNLSDTQVSLLMGFAFSLFYVTMAIPLGRLADRKNRRVIITVGVVLWSLMTAACGLAGKFTHLFLARMGVGVGEASLTPSAMSMISDYFPPAQRGRAIAIYNLGVALGTGFALVLGGMVVSYVATTPPLEIPVFGLLESWQYVFLLVALPGLVVAALMILTVKEPARTELLASHGDGMSFTAVMAYLWQRRKIYIGLSLGVSVATIVGYAYFSWVPAMFVRQFGWSIGEVGKIYGTLILLVGPAGILGGGWLIDWTYRKGRDDAPVFIAMIGAAIAAPAILLMPMMPNGFWTMVMIAPSTFGLSMTTAAGAVAVVVVTPNQIRGQTIAIYTLVISLFGLILGPTGVAIITDYVFADENMVHWSLGLVGVVSAICSAILLASILKPFKAERKALLDQTAGLP